MHAIATGRRMLGLLAVTVVALPALAASPVTLQPHRVAYELSLDPRRTGQVFASARGLIVLEFTGNACSNYTTKFRQATDLVDPEGKSKRLDLVVTHQEEGDGGRFRFSIRNEIDGQIARDAVGEARKAEDGSLGVRMSRPRGQKADLDGAALFPSDLSKRLIAAAQAGKTRFDAKSFDGSEGGQKVFDALATIGAPLGAGSEARTEPPLASAGLGKMPRWPVAIAYFEEGPGDKSPIYTFRSVTYANGVLGDLVFEFSDFSLRGKVVRYEELPAEACSR